MSTKFLVRATHSVRGPMELALGPYISAYEAHNVAYSFASYLMDGEGDPGGIRYIDEIGPTLTHPHGGFIILMFETEEDLKNAVILRVMVGEEEVEDPSWA